MALSCSAKSPPAPWSVFLPDPAIVVPTLWVRKHHSDVILTIASAHLNGEATKTVMLDPQSRLAMRIEKLL